MTDRSRYGATPDTMAEAAKLGAFFHGKHVDLDEGVPFDLDELFARVTGRKINRHSFDDEMAAFYYSRAFEEAAASEE